MEHIVQFGISIDDDVIKKSIESNAEKQIVDEIKQDIRNKIFQPRYYNADATTDDALSFLTLNILEAFFEESKEAIIDKAAEKLADKLARTKAGKAALERAEKGV